MYIGVGPTQALGSSRATGQIPPLLFNDCKFGQIIELS